MHSRGTHILVKTVLVCIVMFGIVASAHAQEFFQQNLQPGDRGEDVQRLQVFLNSHGAVVSETGAGSVGNETTYFGSKTRSALIRFQDLYAEGILTPLNLRRGTGYFYASTRAYINAHFGASTTPDSPIFVAEPASEPVVASSSTPHYTIGGFVTGLTDTVTVRINGAQALVVRSGDNARFTLPRLFREGEVYTLTAETSPLSKSKCFVSSRGTGIVEDKHIADIKIMCVTNPLQDPFRTSFGGGSVATYAIGGSVSGLSGTLQLQNNSGDTLSISTNGSFTFSQSIARGESYSVAVSQQPSSPSQTCTVTGGSGTVSGAVTAIAVVCSTDSFAISGTVSGLSGTVVLQNNGGDTLTVTDNGAFSFDTEVADGAGYSASVLLQPTSPNQTCTVTNASGTLDGGAVTNVSVVCTTNTYTIGGTISNLDDFLELQNNAGDDLFVLESGSFTFDTPIEDGGSYDVTTVSGPGPICEVTGGSGTVDGANVTSVSIFCYTGPSLFMDSISKTYGDSPFTLSIESSSDGAVTYASSNSDVATVSGTTATIVGAGSTSISVTIATSSPYSARTATVTMTVSKAIPTIASISNISVSSSQYTGICFADPVAPIAACDNDGSLVLDFPASSSTVAYSSITSSNVSVINATSNAFSYAGYWNIALPFNNIFEYQDEFPWDILPTSTIATLNQPSNANYEAASTTFSITVIPVSRDDELTGFRCFNLGILIPTNYGSYECICTEEWTGDQCDQLSG